LNGIFKRQEKRGVATKASGAVGCSTGGASDGVQRLGGGGGAV